MMKNKWVWIMIIIVAIASYFMTTAKSHQEGFENIKTMDPDDIMVLCYENEDIKTTNTHNLQFLLHFLNYKYVYFCGQNEIWTSWKGRLESYIKVLNSLDRNVFIILCDGRDVLPNIRYPIFKERALAMYNSTGRKVIFSAEKNCCTGHLGENQALKAKHTQIMENYMAESFKVVSTDHMYLNFGLAFGKANDFLRLFALLENKDKYDFDDQAEMAIAKQKFDAVTMDYDEILFSNLSDNEKCNLQMNNLTCLLKNNNFGTYPAFIHFPGKNPCYKDACKKISQLILLNSAPSSS